MAKKALDINDIDNAYCGCCQHFSDGYCRETKKNLGFFTFPCDKYVEKELPVDPQPTKECKRCGRVLPVSAFGGHAQTADHLQPLCRECMSEAIKGKGGRKPKVEVAQEPKAGRSLGGYTDKEIYDELRRRGWSGPLTRTETLQ